jgi:glycosyltransferase involved in cell wall biosynthesis
MILRWFDKVVAVSAEIREIVLRHGVPSGKVTTVQNGISLKRFQGNTSRAACRKELGISPDSIVVGTVGRISLEKGHENLLIAAREISEKFHDVVFLLVGDGPLRVKLQRKYSSPAILFTGYRKDLPYLFPCMDIFVLPSLLEGLPIALLEAMASKLPVVASRVGEVPSLVGMENGLLVEPNGVGELKTCLIQLIENLPLARTMGDRGHQLVARYFSVERMAHDYMAIYREVMRRRNKRSLLDLENKSVEEDGVAV